LLDRRLAIIPAAAVGDPEVQIGARNPIHRDTATDMRPGTSATVALNVARLVSFVFVLRDTCVLMQVVPPFK